MDLTTKKIDFATLQTAAGYPRVKEMGSAFLFSKQEVEVLRSLAGEVRRRAELPRMDVKARQWTKHNDLQSDTPLVFIDPENGWNELIPARILKCRDPLARVWEMYLKKQIYWADELRDDRVIDAFFDVPYSYEDTGWGVKLKTEGGEDGGAYHIGKAIEDFEKDFMKLHHPQIVIDEGESERLMDLAQNVFSDILTVRRKNVWWWTLGLSFDYVYLRGMEDFMCDFAIEPEWVHRMFDLLCDGKLAMLDFLEKENLLATNTGNTYVGSGGFGFTTELPGPDKTKSVTTQDMWGFCDAQESAQMNPDMYGEFIFPYHKKILERFALSCYGCCEGYDNRWQYVKNLPNLRRVSVSPWAKWDTVPEYLGKNYIASVKPNPAAISHKTLDEDVVRGDCRKAVTMTKGGICEFIMKDNNTLGNNPRNASRWVEIMREEIEKVY